MTIGDEKQKSDQSGAPPDDWGTPPDKSGTPPGQAAASGPSADTPAAPTGWQTTPQPEAPTPTPPPAQGWQTPTQPGWPPQPPAQGWQGWQPPGSSPSWQPTPPVVDGSSPVHRPSRLPQMLAFVAVALLAFSAGMLTDRLAFGGDGASPTATQVASSTGSPQSGPLAGFGTYQEALDTIRAHFVGRSSLTDKQLLYGSIQGMVDSLGDTGHTTFMTPEQYQAEQGSLSGSFAGIGIIGTDSNGVPAVERVLPGTPAQKAGIKSGDQIIAVDGISTSGKTFSDVSPQIRGDPGTKVTLTIVHATSTTPVDITIERQTIKVPSVEWGMIPGTHVADITLFEFSSGAADQLQTVLAQVKAQGATAIVLDMRGNPGGYVSEAGGVAGQFMSGGVLYIREDSNGHQSPISVSAGRPRTDLPMVVLVDRSTASSAEIVTGALQDSHRAKVVGITTVGTGTVLQVYPLSDGSAIALATAEWLTPDGNHIFGHGITPDEMVALPAGTAPLDPATLSTMTATEFKASTDAELLAAVKALGQ